MAARGPVFLPPGGYRMRRRRDAARLVPVAGLFLFLLPLLWVGGEGELRTGASAIYVFVTWSVLILAAGLLSRRLEDPADDAPEG